MRQAMSSWHRTRATKKNQRVQNNEPQRAIQREKKKTLREKINLTRGAWGD